MAPQSFLGPIWGPLGPNRLSNAALMHSTLLLATLRPHDDRPHAVHTIAGHTQTTRLQATRRPHAGHTIDCRLHDFPIPPAPRTMCFKAKCCAGPALPPNATCPPVLQNHTCCTFPSMMHCHNNLNSKHLCPPMDPRTLLFYPFMTFKG